MNYIKLNFGSELEAYQNWVRVLSYGTFCKLVRATDHRWQVHIPVR